MSTMKTAQIPNRALIISDGAIWYMITPPPLAHFFPLASALYIVFRLSANTEIRTMLDLSEAIHDQKDSSDSHCMTRVARPQAHRDVGCNRASGLQNEFIILIEY